MSLNKYMHPRNIYKSPPNFKQLAINYPEFRSHVKQDVTGKVSIDFKDPKALRALTCTLLKKDFDLNVDIPLTKMIPTIPLRLNYILWIEDLLSISGDVNKVTGIDIGTGASCVYSLLAAKKSGWSMIATDIDLDSLRMARENVSRNSLEDLIKVKKVEDGTLLKGAVDGITEEIDFCMCNPPFFSSTQELNPAFKARRPDRPRPRNAFCATVGEVVADGGEIQFVTKIIEESKILDKKIKIYTSMIGHKSSLPPLKALLRKLDVISFKHTEFYQGHTARWGLAWTFRDIDLRTVPEATVNASRKAKPKSPLHYSLLPKLCECDLKNISVKLVEMFDKLEIGYEVVKESKNLAGYCVTARSNTWMHQRRKRRERERLNSVLSDNNNSETKSVDDTMEAVARMKVESPSPKSPTKRELEEEGFYNCKRVKLDVGEENYLKCSVVIRKDDGGTVIELLYLEGMGGKEGVHQLLQYIKNNLAA